MFTKFTNFIYYTSFGLILLSVTLLMVLIIACIFNNIFSIIPTFFILVFFIVSFYFIYKGAL